jgi:APA family basic amino acid/polyamine antiporter
MLNLTTATWIRFVVWMVVGLVVFGLYGVRRSRLRHDGETPTKGDLSPTTSQRT